MSVPTTMQAWAVHTPGPLDTRPLRLVERAVPTPARDEVLLEIEACGVCRTDLHLAEGDLSPRHPATIPGHEVVGRVVDRGADVDRFDLGTRVGVAWLRRTCGRCRWCRRGRENLCPWSAYTGWDADGGFAPYCTVPAAFGYQLPGDVPAHDLAPLLCSGIIGYRSLQRARLPPGGRLGIYGFGASAHLTAQVAIARGARVHVLTRSESAQQLALDLGAVSAGDADVEPPEPLDAAILFAPVGSLVPVALRALDRGGRLAIAGIYLSDIPGLSYEDELFYEKELVSVTANTRVDGEELLAIAAQTGLSGAGIALPLRGGRRGARRPRGRSDHRCRRPPALAVEHRLTRLEVSAMAQRHTDSRAAGTGLLGHRVLPIVLAGAAHDNEVPVTEAELMGGPSPAWSEQEPPTTAERDRSHQRVLVSMPIAVAVPGDAVATVAVQVDPDPIERDAIAIRQRGGDGAQRGRHLRSVDVGIPARSQARLDDLLVVHVDLALPPPPRLHELGEQLVRPAKPPRGDVDPGRVIELDSSQILKGHVDLCGAVIEQ